MIERILLRMALPLHFISRAPNPHHRDIFLFARLCHRPHQHIVVLPHRLYSTTRLAEPRSPAALTDSLSPNTTSVPQPPPPPPPPKAKRSIRPLIYATLFFIVGSTTGHYMRLVVSPPPLPLPDTPEDTALGSHIHNQASKLPIIQSLSTDPTFKSWDAYSTFTPAERPHRLTTGPLGGSRGLGGYQRVFHNAETGEVISVLWIGGALAGWPGVAHGGLLATVLDESLGRCAILRFASRTGVTANLDIKYLRPTLTNSFVVIRCMPVLEGSTDRKGYVEGRVETLDGKVCVEGKALFVMPKTLQLREFKEIEEGKGF